jgi:hypothetical protein
MRLDPGGHPARAEKRDARQWQGSPRSPESQIARRRRRPPQLHRGHRAGLTRRPPTPCPRAAQASTLGRAAVTEYASWPEVGTAGSTRRDVDVHRGDTAGLGSMADAAAVDTGQPVLVGQSPSGHSTPISPIRLPVKEHLTGVFPVLQQGHPGAAGVHRGGISGVPAGRVRGQCCDFVGDAS